MPPPDILTPPETADDAARRGSNQSGMRAWNERLVLTLVRRAGALPKSDIARLTGLSAQTASVIMRRLEQDGLLRRGAPVRGRVGQPSVPMALAPDGAYFLGLKVGRRSADLVLVDFLGQVVATRRSAHPWPLPQPVVRFVAEELPGLVAELPRAARARVAGLGIAMPFQLWLWASWVGAPQAEMDAWRAIDLRAEIAALTDLPVYLQNDATAAGGAELIFGTGETPKDFLYFYIAHFIGGGLVLSGQLQTGRSGNAAAIGSLPVPGPGGASRQLIEAASISLLERLAQAAGRDASRLWDAPEGWDLPDDVVDRWIDEAAGGIAHAILSATAVVDVGTAVVDGWMPEALRTRLVARIADALAALDFTGLAMPEVRAGTVGPNARTLGAAAIPLSQRYMLDPAALPVR